MKIFISLIVLLKTLYGAEFKEKSFYLKQVDYRKRATFSMAIPGFARIRFRPSYEYRYKVKKKAIKVEKKKN